MLKKTFFFIIILSLSLVYLAAGQTSKVGTTSAQLLKIGVGSRAVAMGEAFVSQANDISGVYWNPAGLVEARNREAMFMHSNWLASMRFDFAGIIFPMGQNAGSIALFATMLSTPEDIVRTAYMPEGTGETFQAMDMVAGLAYARKFTDRLNIGMNIKYIRQSIWKMHGNTLAIDFGSIYQTDFKNLRVGISISNFGPALGIGGQSASLFIDPNPDFQGEYPAKAELQAEKWELPLIFRYGISMNLVKLPKSRLTLASDLTHSNDVSEFVNVGGEYAVREKIFLRAGYRGLGMAEAEGGITAGAGFTWNPGSSRLRINYAFVYYGRLEATHRYDLAVTF